MIDYQIGDVVAFKGDIMIDKVWPHVGQVSYICKGNMFLGDFSDILFKKFILARQYLSLGDIEYKLEVDAYKYLILEDTPSNRIDRDLNMNQIKYHTVICNKFDKNMKYYMLNHEIMFHIAFGSLDKERFYTFNATKQFGWYIKLNAVKCPTNNLSIIVEKVLATNVLHATSSYPKIGENQSSNTNFLKDLQYAIYSGLDYGNITNSDNHVLDIYLGEFHSLASNGKFYDIKDFLKSVAYFDDIQLCTLSRKVAINKSAADLLESLEYETISSQEAGLYFVKDIGDVNTTIYNSNDKSNGKLLIVDKNILLKI